MGSLKSLDLVTGIEQVHSNILVNLQDIEGVSSLIVNGGTNSIDIGDFGSKGTLYIYNDNDENLDIQYSDDSTQNLQLRIKNTKATLEDGDILVFDDTDSTFKVDNISNYVGGGTGNYHVLKVEFEANADYETTTILPVGAQIDNLVIRSNGLTTGIAPLQFFINGSTPVLLAEQGVEFDNTAGRFNLNFFLDDVMLILASGENGTFKSEWSGAGFGTGSGTAYLFYWTPLP